MDLDGYVMTEPFKAEKTDKYTCGECMRIFIISVRGLPQGELRKCDLCKREYTQLGSGRSYLHCEHPYLIKTDG